MLNKCELAPRICEMETSSVDDHQKQNGNAFFFFFSLMKWQVETCKGLVAQNRV